MYKFYQEQPENSWAYHPLRDEKSDAEEKKDLGGNSMERERTVIGLGAQGEGLQQGQNKKPEFAGSISSLNNSSRQTQIQPQKKNVLTGYGKRNSLPNWLRGAIDIIEDVASVSSGGVYPRRL